MKANNYPLGPTEEKILAFNLWKDMKWNHGNLINTKLTDMKSNFTHMKAVTGKYMDRNSKP